MAFKGNAFALLRGDDGDDVENILSRVETSAVKAEGPPSAVEKRNGNGKKPQASSQFSSKPQRPFDHEGGRDKGHRPKRHNRNGVERDHEEENVSQQNSRGGSSFKRNNGFRHGERPADSLKRDEGQGNGDGKTKELTDGEGWQVVRSPNNGHKQNNAIGYKPRRRFSSSGDDVDGHVQASRPGNVGGRGRNYGWRRGSNSNGDSGNGREVKVFEDQQHQQHREIEQDGVCDGIVEKQTEANVDRNDKEYRIRNRNSGGNNRDNRGFRRGYGQGGAGAGKDGGERRGNGGSYQRDRHASAGEGEDDGKAFEPTKLLNDKEVQKGSGGTNAGSEGNDGVAAESCKESESKNGKHDQVLSREEADRLAEKEAEAKKMTLQEYEKELKEKRRALESMKTEQRMVTLDKDFESMHIIEKKKEETIFAKLKSDGDKLKKKVTMDKNDHNVHKALMTNFKPARTNYFGRRGGRYLGHEEKGNGGYSGREEGTGNNPGIARIAEEAAGTPSFEDAKQFPALNRLTKA